MSDPVSMRYFALSALVAIVFCGVIPALILPVLMRAFRKRAFMRVKNYAGRLVSLGLGFVWPLWGCAVVIFALMSLVFYNGLPSFTYSVTFFGMGSVIGYAIAAGAVFAFGLIDDIGGASGASKGFKGHLLALAHGKVTTGAVKLFGIGIAALLLARYLIAFDRTELFSFYSGTLVWQIIAVLLLGGSIALSANFVNLCDLRPGRASKVSLVLLVVGLAIRVASAIFWRQGLLSAWYDLPRFFLFLIPTLITLPSDLRERGMLGDAGANPSGLIAGAYLATGLGVVGLVIFFVVMLALNLVSEKISFSRVIERNPLLSRLDQIGRIKKGETD